MVKGTVNQLKTVQERRDGIQILLDEVIRNLTIEGYNPILGKTVTPVQAEGDISPDTPFIAALREAKENVMVGEYTLRDLEDVINGVGKSAVKLRLNTLPVSMITRKHMKLILKDCGNSAHKFNKYRTNLMILFNELFEMEATENDPLSRIKKRKTVKKIRLTLTQDERKKVSEHLYKSHYTFWRLMNIFFHSGSRETEIMQLKFEDVDLKAQRFKVIVRKGKDYREEWRTIKNIALPLWQELLNETRTGQYLFGKFLKPADKPIESYQLGKRWRKYVKASPPKGLGIKADFYSLKHSNLDEIAELLSDKDASKAAGHTNLKITKDYYLFGEEKREHERLKKLDNKFA